jgi:serine/threonine-protein kinase
MSATAGVHDPLVEALRAAFAIERELPGGGMSRVFVARDPALAREVVIKVLPPDMGAAVSVERFKREIALAAKLQHPHIVPVLTAGEIGGTPYYTMPFVEGESLRGRLLRQGELPIGETLAVLKEVARALAYAHERGVVHRDIKPDNVLVSGGSVMVTDFGVAKALVASERSDGDHVPTSLTQLGIALGTPGYMAPEQIAADPNVDQRADLYAFGCMAYELLGGEPPFAGRPAPAVLAAQVSEVPESIAKRRPNTPAQLAELIAQCLEKRPADRPRDATEVLRALDAVALTPSGTATRLTQRVSSRRFVWQVVPWTLSALLIAAFFARPAFERRPPPPTTRLVLDIPPNQRFTMVAGHPVLFSPDGRAVVYAGIGGPRGSQLYYQRLDELEAHALPGTDNPSAPFFSPDGRTVAFGRQGDVVLRTVGVSGGAATTIATGSFRSPTWTESDDMYLGSSSGLMRIRRRDAAGGRTLDTLTNPDTTKGESIHTAPILGPDGKTLIFWVRMASPRTDHLALYHLDSKQITDIEGEATNPLGVVGGYLIFGRNDATLNAIRYDPTMRSLDNAVRVLDGVAWTGSSGTAASLSRDGSLVYVRGATSTQLVITDESGKRIGGTTEGHDFTDPNLSPPAFSPDGRRVAVAILEGSGSEIWLYDIATSILSKLTSHGGIAGSPVWTPDGTRVAFVDRANGALRWIRADGSGAEELLVATSKARAMTFSPDGKYAVITNFAGSRDLTLLPLSGNRTPIPLVHPQISAHNPAISPDGKWMAYASDVTGRMEIYVRPFPGLEGGAIQLSASASGKGYPRWTRDGRLFYLAGDSLVVATLTGGSAPRIATQHTLFEVRGSYAVTADGKRFATVRSPNSIQQLVVVQNWINELRAKLPATKQ